MDTMSMLSDYPTPLAGIDFVPFEQSGGRTNAAGQHLISFVSLAEGASFSNGATTIENVEITERCEGKYIIIAISGKNSNGVTGNADTPEVEIQLDGEKVAIYALPAESGDSSAWQIREVIPVNKSFTGNSSKMRILRRTISVGGNGYRASVIATLVAVAQ